MLIPKHRHFVVLVPKSDAYGIDARSAIVAKAPLEEAECLMVYYEGNRLGAENLCDFIDRVRHAAGRCSERYPTAAMMAIPRVDLVEVARYDLQEHEFTTISNPDALAVWLQGEALPEVGTERFRLVSPVRLVSCPEAAYFTGDGWGDQSVAKLYRQGAHIDPSDLPREPFQTESVGRSLAA